MDAISFTLNGKPVRITRLSPTTTLLNWLRDTARLTGTKEGCAEGDCGACTVAVLDAQAHGGAAWRAVNSCLLMLPMLQGKQVVTVEGLAQADLPHPVQQALVKELGSQCGYCTPGVVMSMFEACYRTDLDQPWQLDDQMCGNLCRCTGYRPIRDATRAIGGTRPDDRFSKAIQAAQPSSMTLGYRCGEHAYENPTTVDQLVRLLADRPEARIICGGTDLSLEVTKQFKELPSLISVEGIPQLRSMQRRDDGSIRLGATATLSDVEAFTQEHCPPLHRMLRYFASRQIKNRATLGGNICNASPIGDTPPVLLALGASVVLVSTRGERTVPLDDFFIAYRNTARQPDEFLAHVDVPPLPPGARASAYKVSKRRELDISAVAAGFMVELNAHHAVKAARVAYGGMAATPMRATRTEAALVGAPWTEEGVQPALAVLQEEFSPLSDHRGSAWYRNTVCVNLLRGFVMETQNNPLPMLPQRPAATLHLEPPAGE